MYQLLIELKDFSAAHRLVKNYRGKCNQLHGHNYALRIQVATSLLGADDLVVDFSVIRKICNEWIQGVIDHCTLVYAEDQPLLHFLRHEKQKHYLFQGNTTVESLAKEIYQHLSALIGAESQARQVHFYLQQVELWESRDCGVIYSDRGVTQKGVVCG